MKWTTAAATAIVLMALAGTASAGDAPRAKRGCSTIDLGGPKLFYKHDMRCAAAKRKAEKVYASRGANEPRHFDCESGSGFTDGGSCHHVSKDKYFGWHPADKAAMR